MTEPHRRAWPWRLSALAVAFLMVTASLVWVLGRSQRVIYVVTPAGSPSAMAIASLIHSESALSPGLLQRPPLGGALPARPRFELRVGTLHLPEPARAAGVSLRAALSGATAERRLLDPAQLSSLLFYSFGVTQSSDGLGVRLRAAPSAGALYPTDLFVVVSRDAQVAAQEGVYYYAPEAHALHRLELGEHLELLAKAAPLEAAPLHIIIGSSFNRTEQKYGKRAYRYATLDAGHVAGSLQLVSRTFGWRCEPKLCFDDALIGQALGLKEQVEGVLMVLACSPRDRAESSSLTMGACTMRSSLPDLSRLSEPARAHLLTSWERGTSPVAPPLRSDTTPFFSLSHEVALPESALSMDAYLAVRMRRSRRRFGEGFLEQEQLNTVVGAALAAPLWQTMTSRLHVAVRGVRGLPPGLYRFGGQPGRWLGVSLGSMLPRVQAAALGQELFARASAVLIWSFEVEQSERVFFNRGFRHAALFTGMAGQRAYLAAAAVGLGICGVGAFYDAELQGILAQEEEPLLPLYLMALGPM